MKRFPLAFPTIRRMRDRLWTPTVVSRAGVVADMLDSVDAVISRR